MATEEKVDLTDKNALERYIRVNNIGPIAAFRLRRAQKVMAGHGAPTPNRKAIHSF